MACICERQRMHTHAATLSSNASRTITCSLDVDNHREESTLLNSYLLVYKGRLLLCCGHHLRTSRSSHIITTLLQASNPGSTFTFPRDSSYQLSLKINITMAARPDPGWSRFQCPNFVNCGQLVRVARSYCSQCTVCILFSLFSSTALNRGWSDADY